MPKIPQLQKMYIKPAVDYAAGSTENVIAQALATTSQIALKFNNIQDATESQKAIADAKNSFYKFEEEAKIKYADDPDTFETEINNYKNTLLNATMNNTKVSRFNKSKFESTLNNSFSNVDRQTFDNKRKLQVQKFNSNINTALANNNNASYINGKNNNFETFTNDLTTQLNNVAIIGREIMSPNELNVKLGEVRRQSTDNFITGELITNTQLAKQRLESGVYKELLDQKTIDKYIADADKLTKIQEDSYKENYNANQKQLMEEKQPLLTSDMMNYYTKINNLNLSTIDGKKNSIKNINLNQNFDAIVESNLFLQSAKSNGLSNKEYTKEQAKLNNIIYNNFIKEDTNIKNKTSWFKPDNVNNIVVDYLNKNFNTFDKEQKASLYLAVGNYLKKNNLDFTSTDVNQIATTRKIIEEQIKDIYNLPEKSDIQSYLLNKKNNEETKFNQDLINKVLQNKINNENPFILSIKE